MVFKTADKIASELIKCFKNGNKCLLCGNGGSAAQAQHMAAELMGKFEYERDPIPAIALTTDTSFLTAWSNDCEYDTIFSRQIQALGEPGDVLVVFSTSGNSRNCLLAIEKAREKHMEIIDFSREGKNTAEIQEFQLKLMHDVVRLVEREMFP